MDIKELLKNKKYFIFDLDGTLIDLENLNFNSFRNVVLKYFKVDFSYEMYLKHFAGVGSRNGFLSFSNEYGTRSDLDDVIKEWQKEYRATKRFQLHNNFYENVKPISGAIEYIKFLKEKGEKIALGTSSAREFTEIILEKLGIIGYFDSIVTVDDVKNTKPNPETFLTALKNIGGNKEESIIFEDSPNGIKCAQNTGIDYIVIHTKGKNDVVLNQNYNIIENYTTLLYQD